MIDFARFARGVSPLALAAAVALTAVPAHAQEGAAASQSARSYDIPAQPLDQALAEFARAADVQLAYSAQLVAERSSPGVDGRLTAQDALARLLGGTGLTFRMTDARTFTLVSGGGADGELVTGVVSIEASQGSPYFGGAGVAAGVNGTNGSRDITATEGTGSFTSGALTIGSKVPQALKDVPQSVSVLTSERMAQQNVADFDDAMRQLPGITLVQGDTSLQTTFLSRGLGITSIQIDGGAPLRTFIGDGDSALFLQVDMSVYDHVELLRGAAGLFNGFGNPGGTVNLVRKKPLDHSQYSIEAQAGSWNTYRVVADATSPLAFDGKLRGRLVMTHQSNDYFYDRAKDKKELIYGIVELDATPTTLLTAGISYTDQNSIPWQNGLPRFENGGDLELPRSTSLVFEWNRWDFTTTDIFGAIEQTIGKDWFAKLNVTHSDQKSYRKVGASNHSVSPYTGEGALLADGSYFDFVSKQLSAEATVSGAFTIFGQRQEITIGANHVKTDGGSGYNYNRLLSTFSEPYQPYPGGPIYCVPGSIICPEGSINAYGVPIDIFNFDPSAPIYSEPPQPRPGAHYTVNRQTQWGAYFNVRLTAFDRLHLQTGMRWSKFKYTIALDYLASGGEVAGSYSGSRSDTEVTWPPAVSLSYDVTNALTAYLGYTDIYQEQSTNLDSNLNPVAPITGSNWEAGLKWAPKDGRLNLSLAAFRVKRKGFATVDGEYDYTTGEFVASDGQRFPNYGSLPGGLSCCYKSDPDRTQNSEGIELEGSGELWRGWQVSAGYTYNVTKFVGDGYGANVGKPFQSIQPKHLYKLWTSFDFGAAGKQGWLSALTLSLGVNGQTAGYRTGSVCVNLLAPDPVSGDSACASYSPPDYVDYEFTVPPHAVVSGRIDYRLSDTWSLSVNLENIFDKTYYQTVGYDPNGGNWYGAPRSIIATLRAKW